MPQQIYPEPVASTTPNAKSYTVPAALTKYRVVQTFTPAIYTITTSPTTSQATIQFYDSSNTIGSTSTISGTITYNLASTANAFYINLDAGSGTIVTLTPVASALSGTTLSGTLDTITTTSTYNQTGQLFVGAFGGGGGGASGGTNQISGYNAAGGGGGGGGSGFWSSGIYFVNTSTSISIGASGNGGAKGLNPGNAGGTTNFGNLVSAAGGNGGNVVAGQGGGGGGGAGAGGSTSSAYNNSTPGGNGAPSITVNPELTGNSTTGGGAGGGNSWNSGGNNGGTGGGSGIGTGGNGGNWGENSNTANAGNAGTGYASGGGGGGASRADVLGGGAGAAGRPGVVYVLRGI